MTQWVTTRDRNLEAEERNRVLWDELAPVHLAAYGSVQKLRRGEPVLDDVELKEVGDVAGKRLLHLQCHIGTDSLAWARRGARVTGVDFSPASIACARELARELGIDARFIRSSIFDLPDALDERFDIIYTSRGVLCWLRDLPRWGQVIAHFLRPGGVAYVLDTHPVCDMLEENEAGELNIVRSYFHQSEPTVWDDEEGDYADPSFVPQHPSYEWYWSVGDIINALLDAGLQLEFFNEHDAMFFQRFPSMITDDGEMYHLPAYEGLLPLTFSLRARKGATGQRSRS